VNEKKYIVLPGYVDSKNDGERHYISAQQLIDLYGVNIKLCVIVPYGSEHRPRGYSEEQFNSMIKLYPRFHGDYNL